MQTSAKFDGYLFFLIIFAIFAPNMEHRTSFIIFPTYSEIFEKGQREVIDQLSKEGLAEKFIIYSSYYSSLSYTEHIQGVSVQTVIMRDFKEILCNTKDGHKILDWLSCHNLSSLNINTFTMMSVFQLLLNNRKGNCVDLSQTDEEKLLYLKLILIANESRINKSKEFYNTIQEAATDDTFFYGKCFWPLLLAESDVNETINVGFEMFRLKSIIDYIIVHHPDAKDVIKDFFQERGFDGYISYATCFFIIYLDFITNFTNNGVLRTGIAENEQARKLLMPLIANTQKIDTFLNLKSHPLYYYNNAFYVINWSYLLSQIYIGTFMALEKELRTIGICDLKKEAGVIMEKTLFKNVLTNSFGKIWQKASFDETGGDKPDAIIQMGNNLFIIELKDRLMDEGTMESFDFKCIEKHFRESFIEKVIHEKGKDKVKKKGIGQLASYITNYVGGRYKEFPYNPKLNIYPIIVYTDYKYRLNGLNHYLSTEFNSIIDKDENLSSLKRRIRPMTIIGLDCFFDLQVKFQKKKVKLAYAIDNYHRHNKLFEKKYSDKGIEKYSQLYSSFERYLPENHHFLVPFEEMQSVFKRFFFE